MFIFGEIKTEKLPELGLEGDRGKKEEKKMELGLEVICEKEKKNRKRRRRGGKEGRVWRVFMLEPLFCIATMAFIIDNILKYYLINSLF